MRERGRGREGERREEGDGEGGRVSGRREGGRVGGGRVGGRRGREESPSGRIQVHTLIQRGSLLPGYIFTVIVGHCVYLLLQDYLVS